MGNWRKKCVQWLDVRKKRCVRATTQDEKWINWDLLCAKKNRKKANKNLFVADPPTGDFYCSLSSPHKVFGHILSAYNQQPKCSSGKINFKDCEKKKNDDHPSCSFGHGANEIKSFLTWKAIYSDIIIKIGKHHWFSRTLVAAVVCG